MSNILIIKMWALGDIVMATPMLNALKSPDENRQVTWLVDKTHADALLRHPLIDEVIVMDTGEWRRQLKRSNLAAWSKTAWNMMRSLSSKKFDSVINCHPEKWWTLLFCQAPNRVALFPGKAEAYWSAFYNKVIERPTNPRVHNTVHYLLATRALDIADGNLQMSIADSPAADRSISELLEAQHVDASRRVVLMAPYSTAENRNWPDKNFKLLAEYLIRNHGAFIIITAGPSDRLRIDDLAAGLPPGSSLAANDTTVAEYIALIRRSSLVICNDSSPLHIAAALCVPYIALFGATPVDERSPLVGAGRVVGSKIECSPCDKITCSNIEFRKCMNVIELREVETAATELLGRPDV